jgi:hypothetical protein
MNTESFESFVNEFLEGGNDLSSEGGEPRNPLDILKRKVQKWGRKTFSPEGVITIVFTTNAALNPITRIPGTDNETMDKIKELLDTDSAERNKLLLEQYRSGSGSYLINKRTLYRYIFSKSYSMLSGGKEAFLTEAIKEAVRKAKSDLFDDVFGPRLANFKRMDINRKLQFLSQTVGVIQQEENMIRDQEIKDQLANIKAFLDTKLSQSGGSDDILDGGALPLKIAFKGLPNITWDNDISMHEAIKQINGNATVQLEKVTFDRILVLKEQKDGMAVIIKLL